MELFWNISYWALTLLYTYIAVVVVITIILENRNPVKTLAWVTIMVLLPIVGIVLYIFFGKNFRRKKIIKNKLDYPIVENHYELPIKDIKNSDIPERFQKVAQLLYNNSQAALYPNNKIEVFATGMTAFDSIFNDIEKAQKSIHIEFYIIENDDVGNKLHELLIKKAHEGVRVRVIYDYLGGYHLPPLWRKTLKDAGVYIQPFLEAKSLLGFLMINYRNHRKQIIIDGEIGYTGGMNMAERYRHGNRLGNWRDTFIRIEGPAVHALQYNFLVDWSFVDGKLITDLKYYPIPKKFDETNLMQIVASGPDTDWANIKQGILSAISNAQKQILIHTPYCMPPESILNALETAALSGIDVKIMIPERNDSKLVAAAGRSFVEGMLQAGIEVYYYRYNFLHSKAIVIDNCLSIVGTANMDNRSYEQNFEIAAFIYDTNTANILTHNFEKDLQVSRLLNLNVWKHRKKYNKVTESIARLFSPLM